MRNHMLRIALLALPIVALALPPMTPTNALESLNPRSSSPSPAPTVRNVEPTEPTEPIAPPPATSTSSAFSTESTLSQTSSAQHTSPASSFVSTTHQKQTHTPAAPASSPSEQSTPANTSTSSDPSDNDIAISSTYQSTPSQTGPALITAANAVLPTTQTSTHPATTAAANALPSASSLASLPPSSSATSNNPNSPSIPPSHSASSTATAGAPSATGVSISTDSSGHQIPKPITSPPRGVVISLVIFALLAFLLVLLFVWSRKRQAARLAAEEEMTNERDNRDRERGDVYGDDKMSFIGGYSDMEKAGHSSISAPFGPGELPPGPPLRRAGGGGAGGAGGRGGNAGMGTPASSRRKPVGKSTLGGPSIIISAPSLPKVVDASNANYTIPRSPVPNPNQAPNFATGGNANHTNMRPWNPYDEDKHRYRPGRASRTPAFVAVTLGPGPGGNGNGDAYARGASDGSNYSSAYEYRDSDGYTSADVSDERTAFWGRGY